MDLGGKLQKLRKENNMTQNELADKLYVSRTAVSKWESGRGYPNIDSLRAIAKVFSVTVDGLLSNEEILILAKTDSKKNIKKIELRIFGILDIMTLLYIFIPLFSQKETDGTISMTSLAWADSFNWVQVTYIVLISITVLSGVVEEVLQCFASEKMCGLLQAVSLSLHSLLILLFIASMQPYPAALHFSFLLAKIIILLKPLRKRTEKMTVTDNAAKKQ